MHVEWPGVDVGMRVCPPMFLNLKGVRHHVTAVLGHRESRVKGSLKRGRHLRAAVFEQGALFEAGKVGSRC